MTSAQMTAGATLSDGEAVAAYEALLQQHPDVVDAYNKVGLLHLAVITTPPSGPS